MHIHIDQLLATFRSCTRNAADGAPWCCDCGACTGRLQAISTPQDYLVERLDFHDTELVQLGAEFDALPHLDPATMHTNVQALRGLGRSVGQVKALVLRCPPVLTLNFEAFLSFFYSCGATPRVRSCPAGTSRVFAR